ncbi:hypothetical protein MHK_003505 [Candidatus Magnetomorum sp. HK-1]|nr:hypothetical protein MHK_003505 [Candidatus Magnetomorum sp. HK-1]
MNKNKQSQKSSPDIVYKISDTKESITPQEYFKESPENLFLVKDIQFKQDATHNANVIWGEDKMQILPSKWPFSKKTKKTGVKQFIYEKLNETELLFTDIIICVHTDDYNNTIARARKNSGKNFDYGAEEESLLKQYADEHFGREKTIRSEISANRSFRFKIEEYDLEELRNAFLVVIKKNIYIETPEDKILAYICCDQNNMKIPYFEGQLCFEIGSGKFNNISIDELPDDITINFFYEKKFGVEYPGKPKKKNNNSIDSKNTFQLLTHSQDQWFVEEKIDSQKNIHLKLFTQNKHS